MIKDLKDKDKRAFALIRNRIIHGDEGPTLREINEVTGGKSPRSASLVLNRLIEAGLIKKIGREVVLTAPPKGQSISTIDVPLVGAVSCGMPVLAEENIQDYIPVSTAMAKNGGKYFLLRAIGDSMDDAGINPGDLLLVRQQASAENGDKVVALINDEATAKIFEKAKNAVILKPKSKNKEHKPIILTDDCMIQGVVTAVLPGDLCE